MRIRRRASTAGRKQSVEAEQKRWASPRKRRKTQMTDYVSMEGREDSDSNSDHEQENEEEVVVENPEKSPARWVVTCGTKKGRGYLKPPSFKRRTFTASEMLNHKTSHHKESADKSDHEEEDVEEEELVETSEELTDVQNGEQTNDLTIDIASIVSHRKPILILHRLEHLQGDFHLLLNNAVLPQNGGGPKPTTELSVEMLYLSEEDTSPGPVETSEHQEETSSKNSDNENQEPDMAENMHTEETTSTKDQGVDVSHHKE
ncbi:hypothetical protein WMY93_003163 [Mugilogobius chulae]|uniref:Uncharacterized protein n=1 Tax=Mugilogobius chulae TaxID=88201 RepID=A0AAW0Q6J3_9GOBI